MRYVLVSLLGVLAMACPGDDGPTGETGAGSDGSGTAGSGSGSAGTADTSNGTGNGTTASTEPTTMGDTAGSSGGTNIIDVCREACEHLVMCGAAEVPNCGIPCAGIESMVAGCEEPYIAQQQCVVGLTCEEANEWSGGMSDLCAAEDQELAICTGGGTG